MTIPRQETDGGFEKQLGVNHLGHFAHTARKVDFDGLLRTQSYRRWEARGRSKLANLLFAYEPQRRSEAADVTDTISVACHPGHAATTLQYRRPRESGSALRLGVMNIANARVGQPAEDGTRPLLYAAAAPNVAGGEYYGPGGLLNVRGAPRDRHPTTHRMTGPPQFDSGSGARA